MAEREPQNWLTPYRPEGAVLYQEGLDFADIARRESRYKGLTLTAAAVAFLLAFWFDRRHSPALWPMASTFVLLLSAVLLGSQWLGFRQNRRYLNAVSFTIRPQALELWGTSVGLTDCACVPFSAILWLGPASEIGSRLRQELHVADHDILTPWPYTGGVEDASQLAYTWGNDRRPWSVVYRGATLTRELIFFPTAEFASRLCTELRSNGFGRALAQAAAESADTRESAHAIESANSSHPDEDRTRT